MNQTLVFWLVPLLAFLAELHRRFLWFFRLVALPVSFIGIMMSFSHTTGAERSGVLCTNSCKKGFLLPLQEDLAPALRPKIQMGHPLFESPLDESGKQNRRKRQQEKCCVMPSSVGSYLQGTYCVHLTWVSTWSLCSCVSASRACVEL